MGVYFPKLKIPSCCENCGQRDAEYDSNCMLMPMTDFESLKDQFAVCPIRDLARTYNAKEISGGFLVRPRKRLVVKPNKPIS